jgi:hypothetical protein
MITVDRQLYYRQDEPLVVRKEIEPVDLTRDWLEKDDTPMVRMVVKAVLTLVPIYLVAQVIRYLIGGFTT